MKTLKEVIKDLENKNDPVIRDSIMEPIYETDKKYIVADTEEDLEASKREYILVDYAPNTYYPFVCVRKEDEECYNKGEEYYTVSWKYAKPIPEYKPYPEPKLEWLGKKVREKLTDFPLTIHGILEHNCVLINDNEFSMKNLLHAFTWEDGSICGELKSGIIG